MSSGGSILGGIVGAVIGFMGGGGPAGAWKGFQIGSTIGGIVDPPKGPNINGPRLSDLSVQTSTYGTNIPRNYGTVAQFGNIIWLKGDSLTEVKTETESGGKGAPSSTSTTYSYFATFAVALCEGPIDGIRKIWIGPDLFYDASVSNTGPTGASSGAMLHKSGINQVNVATPGFIVYTGSETQNPDPLIQADKGVANTPAYRGIAYIVFNNLALAKYSNSLLGAQVKVEIVKSGTLSRSAPETLVSGTPYNGATPVYDSKSGILVYLEPWFDLKFYNLFTRALLFTVNTGAVNNWNIFSGAPGTFWSAQDVEFVVYDFVSGAKIGSIARTFDAVAIGTYYSAKENAMFVPSSGLITKFTLVGRIPVSSRVIYDGQGISIQSMEITKNGYIVLYSDFNKKIVVLAPFTYAVVGLFTTTVGGSGTHNHTSTYNPVNDTVYIIPSPQDRIITVALNAFNYATVTETLTSAGGNRILYHKQSDTLILQSSVFVSPMAEIRDPYSLALIDSYSITTNYNAWPIEIDGLTDKYLAFNTNIVLVQFGKRIEPLSIPLSDIVQDECISSNLLTAGDIDVTSLTDNVRGYRIASVGAIRGALDQLRGAWPFDVVQSGYKIKFKKRGSSSVITIPEADLDARAAGENPGISISNAREMDSVLPRKVSLKYLDVNREYDINEQYEERLNTDAVNIRSIDLTIAFTATEARQKAEMLLYLGWLERYDVGFKLPSTYAQLEPGDVITINTTKATYVLRLTSITTLPDGRMECQAKYSNSAIFVPAAIGSEGSSVGQSIKIVSPSIYKLLDIPMMRDDDNTAGFPVAMGGFQSGWPGGTIYRSDDDGATWANIASVGTGQVMALATNTLSAHGGTVYDKSSRLNVRVYVGDLSSVTEAQMLVGQNWFAYGLHGRWEIIAAQNCVLQGDGTYILSDFMRGQIGTEWATGLHVAGDDLIYLNTTTLEFISVNSSSINAPRLYRGITFGKELDSDYDYSFTYSAVNLECLSPVHLTGNRHPSTNDWSLTWVRRSRYAGWRDYVDAPLGEATESYEIDVYANGTYTTVKRTLTSSTPSAAYTSANQVTDFGSNQATLYLKIYQLSSIVGRGYPLTQSITR